MFDLTEASIVFTHILFSKFWKMRLSMMVSLVVFVSAPRPSTSDRLTSAFSSRLALRLNTSSSSRPFAPSTAPTWSRSETPRFLELGLVSARSIVRVTPVRLLAVVASSSKISVLIPRLFTSSLTISRAAKASIPFCYSGLESSKRWQNRLPLLSSEDKSPTGIIIFLILFIIHSFTICWFFFNQLSSYHVLFLYCL